MASFLVADVSNWVTIATLGRRVPFIVVGVSTGDDQPWLRPSPGLWRMRRAEVVTISVLLGRALRTGVLGRGAARWPGSSAWWSWWRSARRFSFFLRRRFRAWRYQERNEDLIVARGVMVQRLSVVPYGRMQFVEVTAGPVERLFKLSTVKLHTAAAASDARIPGLEQAEAARLRDRLTELGESMAAGM